MFEKLKFRTKITLGFIIMFFFIAINLILNIVVQRSIYITRINEIEINTLSQNVNKIRLAEKEFILANKREYASEVNKLIIKTANEAKAISNRVKKVDLDVIISLLSSYEEIFYRYTAIRDQRRALDSKMEHLNNKIIKEVEEKGVLNFDKSLHNRLMIMVVDFTWCSTAKDGELCSDDKTEAFGNLIIEIEKKGKGYSDTKGKIELMSFIFDLKEYLQMREKIKSAEELETEWIKELTNISMRLEGEFQQTLSQMDREQKKEKVNISIVGVFIYIVFVALTVFILISVGKTTKKSLDDIIKVTKSVSEGNYGTRIEVKVNDQLGELGENFNIMAQNLKDYEDKMNIYNKGLEAIIKDRTEELQEAVTSLEEYQREIIKAKEKAESASRAKSEFVSNMSHELRTPLNAILGFTDILYNDENDERKRGAIVMIKEAGESLLGIINDILDISKIEAGMMRIKTEPFGIEEVSSGMVKMFAKSAETKGNKFVINNDCSNRFIIGDILRVKQILINLIGNSIKFTEKGTILLDIKEQNIEGDKVEVTFRVSDTGIGIGEDKMQNLFEMFNQGEHHLTKKYGGTGIGLAIVKKLTDLMGGEVTASSRVGMGTEFVVKIPFRLFKPN